MARTPVLLLMLALLTAGCASDDDDADSDSTTTSASGTVSGTVSASGSVSVSGTGAPSNQTTHKQITDDDFPDGDFTVRRGDTVNWTHAGQNPHSVTADLGLFDSSPGCSSATPEGCMQNGDHFVFEFETVGTFTYKCKIHPTTMTGTVTVTN